MSDIQKVVLLPEQAWNLDDTLASVIAQGLDHLLNGHCEQDREMPLVRDCFKAYSKRWDFDNSWDYHDSDKPEGQMMLWALEWLKDNFFGLWD